ncbi:MAG: c-type cytochrome [Candidatus Acidiferrales bacterium]
MASVFAAGAAAHGTKKADAQAKPTAPQVRVTELHAARNSPMDLEIGGELAGVPPGTTRYVTRDELLALPQVTYTVTDDANFAGPTRVSGVPLEDLMRYLGASPTADLVVAICDDAYRANYPRAYLDQHHPLLVLEVNGKAPSGWPKDSGGHGFDMGPYMISHPKFTPSFQILSHTDEPQIPWGVVRLEFRDEKAVFGAIAPHGPHANDPAVQAGYKITQQNCFRCHNMGAEGGQKSKVSWTVLSALAAKSPEFFASYVREARAQNPNAQMPGNPGYDEATIRALVAYFETFSQPEKP